MFSWKQGIGKTLKSILIVGLPILIVYLNATGLGSEKIIDLIVKSVPALGSLTVSGVVLLVIDYFKHK